MDVLFVCLGNICRSPTAEGIFRQRLRAAGLEERVRVDSAGTGHWHVGKGPDPRTCRAALRRGYDLSALRARQVAVDDYSRFDLILAMDHDNLLRLKEFRPDDARAEVDLFLGRFGLGDGVVPDPYHGGEAGFEAVLDLVERGCDALLDEIKGRL
ncbi:MAG TPA: low molecular weight protein-tyrosine-phosphatase [Pseudomonas sp.]|nr:low molecular weight protein-tyrosine-phosphatase [Pseudomonas sp.]